MCDKVDFFQLVNSFFLLYTYTQHLTTTMSSFWISFLQFQGSLYSLEPSKTWFSY